jgi:hypothetical protein
MKLFCYDRTVFLYNYMTPWRDMKVSASDLTDKRKENLHTCRNKKEVIKRWKLTEKNF